jgi:hypothetical protein
MAGRIVTRIVAFLLVLESSMAGLWIAALLPTLGVRGWLTSTLVACRAIVSACELSGAVWLYGRRRPGAAVSRWALIASAILTTFEIGWRLAPSNLDYTFRWWCVGAYWAYAVAAFAWLRRAAE